MVDIIDLALIGLDSVNLVGDLEHQTMLVLHSK